jgi:hypothetical protein
MGRFFWDPKSADERPDDSGFAVRYAARQHSQRRYTTMKTNTPTPHVKVSYTGEADKDVAAETLAAINGLTGNPNFSNPPVDLALLRTTLEAFVTAIANLIDGGKKVTAEKNKQRGIVVKMMRQLGHWVEANCKDDLTILKSSGFQPVSTTRTSAQPLEGPPAIVKVDNGPNSGQFLVQLAPDRRVHFYFLRSGAIGLDGKVAVWTELPPFSSTKPPASINGLTPGTNYAIQVRGLGRLGFSDWSDSATRISN